SHTRRPSAGLQPSPRCTSTRNSLSMLHTRCFIQFLHHLLFNKQSSGQSPEIFNRNKFFFYLNENLRFSNFPCFNPRQASENSSLNTCIKEHKIRRNS